MKIPDINRSNNPCKKAFLISGFHCINTLSTHLSCPSPVLVLSPFFRNTRISHSSSSLAVSSPDHDFDYVTFTHQDNSSSPRCNNTQSTVQREGEREVIIHTGYKTLKCKSTVFIIISVIIRGLIPDIKSTAS